MPVYMRENLANNAASRLSRKFNGKPLLDAVCGKRSAVQKECAVVNAARLLGALEPHVMLVRHVFAVT